MVFAEISETCYRYDSSVNATDLAGTVLDIDTDRVSGSGCGVGVIFQIVIKIVSIYTIIAHAHSESGH